MSEIQKVNSAVTGNNMIDFMSQLDKTIEENEKLTNSIIEKLSQIDVSPSVAKEEPPKEKVYFLPAKRNERRVWINRIVDKLAIVQGGDTRMAAGAIWNDMYDHLEKETGVNIRQEIRTHNRTCSFKNQIKSRMSMVCQSEKWMDVMLKRAYDMAINHKIPLPKDFKLVKVIVAAK